MRPIERSVALAVDRFDVVPPAVRAVVWMLEELRMSTFAQPLGVVGPISEKRIRAAYREATGDALE